jgi:hypothetical protein
MTGRPGSVAVEPGGVQVNNVRRRIRWLLAERTMWAVAVVVSHVLAEDRRQMTLSVAPTTWTWRVATSTKNST